MRCAVPAIAEGAVTALVVYGRIHPERPLQELLHSFPD
jgi:hypothetical protein